MKLIGIDDARAAEHDGLGGKAANLVRLAAAGLPTPKGWVAPMKAFDNHLALCGLPEALARISAEPSEEFLRDVRDRIVSQAMGAKLNAALEDLPDGPMAVRSSASAEDQAAASYSGLFETVLGVSGAEALADAVKRVWASVFTQEALAYHRRVNSADPHVTMAVLIMPMVAAEVAGVAFSANPADGNPFEIAVSACRGLGTTVVDGTERCDEYLMDLDSLETKEARLGAQCNGLFLGADGSVETRSVPADLVGRRLCEDQVLRRLGEMVRATDDLLDLRVDVEFAVTNGQITLLQARPLIGLPPCFPDNPEDADPPFRRSGVGERLALSPFVQAGHRGSVRATSPPPPWPLEVEELTIRHDHLFFRRPENPEYEERPEASWEDRTFLRRMSALDDPADDLREARRWTATVYAEMIPPLRARAERALRKDRKELADLDPQGMHGLLHEALALECDAWALYVSASSGTWETLRRIDLLTRDWITGPDHKASEPIAHATILGAAKLTHERDGELEGVATGQMGEDEYACRWGYGYLAINDMLDLSKWRSWREDPTPVRVAAGLLRKRPNAVSFAERIRQSVDGGEEAFRDALARIGGDDEAQIQRRRRIYAACVEAGRMVFPLKDDRDLVLAHCQSALRWVLMEVGRRLEASDVDDVFLLEPGEISEWLRGGCGGPDSVRQLLEDRRRERRRMARYTLPQEEEGSSPVAAGPIGAVLEGRPASAGVAEGPARIVNSLADAEALQPGEILCLLGERRVGWTMFFPIIAGLAYECGNWLCHEANLCRELGIPAVVGLGDQIRHIRSGEDLRLDGVRGVVGRQTEEIASSPRTDWRRPHEWLSD